jgi:glutamate/tyrosine decarboxylase-like PLP-dependent enzyme
LQRGVGVEEQGLSGLPPSSVLTSGNVHASAVKALAKLGIGRQQAQTFAADGSGRLDGDALEDALRRHEGSRRSWSPQPGEVNAGGFDSLALMADLAAEYGAWLHVVGAFGLFAAGPRRRRARDGHRPRPFRVRRRTGSTIKNPRRALTCLRRQR